MTNLEDLPEPIAESAPSVPKPVKDLLIVKTIEGQPWTLEFLSERHLRDLPAVLEGVTRLNQRMQDARLTNLPRPVFKRSFFHNLWLGGRFVTQGPGNVHAMSKRARRHITINREPVVEVDITASRPTVFLALMEPEKVDPDRDLYAIDGFSRDSVRSFLIQSLGQGRTIRHWAHSTDDKVRKVPLPDVRKAVLSRFPSFERIAEVVPAVVAGHLSPPNRLRAVGLYLSWQESVVLEVAMDHLAAQGVPAIPLHDALIVPVSGAEEAKRALEEAFAGQLGVRPRVVVAA